MEQNEIDALLSGVDTATPDAAADQPEPAPEPEPEPAPEPEVEMSMEEVMRLEGIPIATMPEPPPPPPPKAPIPVTVASFEEVNQAEPAKQALDLDFVLDIPLSLHVELGRNRLLISELLQLGQGSVVELTKLAGESLDVYVNQRLIARGEVVVVNEKFGVRLTDIVSPVERIHKLR